MVVVVSFPFSPLRNLTYLALKTAAATVAAASRRAALRGMSTAAIAGVAALATEEGLSGIIVIFLFNFFGLSSSFAVDTVVHFFFLFHFFFRPFPPLFFRFDIYKGKRKEATTLRNSRSFSSSS